MRGALITSILMVAYTLSLAALLSLFCFARYGSCVWFSVDGSGHTYCMKVNP
jgi:hypothetical protein